MTLIFALTIGTNKLHVSGTLPADAAVFATNATAVIFRAANHALAKVRGV